MRTAAEQAAAFRALHERPGAREMKNRGGSTWVRDTVPGRELEAIFKGWS